MLDLGGDAGAVLVVQVLAVKLGQDFDVVIYVAIRIRQQVSFDAYVGLTKPSDDKFHHIIINTQRLLYVLVHLNIFIHFFFGQCVLTNVTSVEAYH